LGSKARHRAFLTLLSKNRNEILEAEGVVPDYEDGIRITDAKTLQIARVRTNDDLDFEPQI
jgi:hypothetical protein